VTDLQTTVDLPHGRPIPRLGLGVYRAAKGRETQDAVIWALERGYRHIDTAHVYRNEADVGIGIRASGVPRGELFVTTKLWNRHHGYDATLAACHESLEALGLDFVDLYLIHWPPKAERRETWRAMETILADGLAKAIGVSNFMVRHLEELAESCEVMPAVNQIELHPFCQQRDAVDWCRANGIVVEAYSPLTKAKKLDDRTVRAVADEVSRTPAQVLLRWSLQRGFVALPKSVNQRRIDENASVFDFTLSETQMARLDALEAGLHLAWDPTDEP